MPFRRSYQRFLIHTRTKLIHPNGAEKELFMEDLSSRGSGVMSDYPIAPEERVRITIDAPFLGKPFAKEAKVVWCRKMTDDLWRSGLDFGMDNLIEIA